MEIISVINHKGGVGKTTFTGCLSQALALTGFRVLTIDNDSQHNLCSMLGTGVQSPSIRDIYRAPRETAPRVLFEAVRTSFLPNLNIITASRNLSTHDVTDSHVLKRVLSTCSLERFYDYVLIDNPPGFDSLQLAAMYASNKLFVPTELRQFAVDGIVEMDEMLRTEHPGIVPITKIIPNFYRGTKRHNSYLAALGSLFPGCVTETALPVDNVFDELITDGKVLFLNRLYSKGAAYYLKLMHELFSFDENDLWEKVAEKRRSHIQDEARERFYRQQERKALQ